MYQENISLEQKAHDLAVAYANYLASSRDEQTDLDAFYQDYENAYQAIQSLVKRNA